MDDNQFIVEMVSNLAWPIVVVVSVFLLKDKLKSLFGGGVKSAKYGDKEIHFFDGQQTTKATPSEQQDLKHLIPEDPTGIRDELDQRIRGQLSQINTDEEKIDVLVKNLAQQQLTSAFEKVYYYIFGSQIRLLEFLSVQESGTSETTDILPFFEEFKKSNPESLAEAKLSDYLNFFVSWGLLQCGDNQYTITKQGRAFLTYITAMQLNKNKAM